MLINSKEHIEECENKIILEVINTPTTKQKCAIERYTWKEIDEQLDYIYKE